MKNYKHKVYLITAQYSKKITIIKDEFFFMYWYPTKQVDLFKLAKQVQLIKLNKLLKSSQL